ncbi:hypothetical protein EJ08DRAFT_679758 [Tothia fuscella]|uniref:Rhodopsin domain-containing protein n=1 Tax=Tothia fuscella TaxID=1048955 RepID=A0A9P4NQG7_9PEZI|nr:hypothetical protein EJ08DRAFT_679758 [Tothia fuscella]
MVNIPRAINGVVSTFLILSTVCVALRVYTRRFLVKKLHISDYLIVLTQIFTVCEAAYIFLGVKGGIGNASFEPTPDNIVAALRNQLIIELFFVVAITFLRISIGLQLWALVKLQNVSSQKKIYSSIQRILIIGVVAIMSIYGIVWFFVLLFQCTPVHFFWTRALGDVDGTCLSNDVQAGVAYSHSGLSALSDFIMGLLPVWILWSVNMPLRTKITVAGLLAVGASFFGDPVSIILCSFIELALGIIATCIATLRPLYLKSTNRQRTTLGGTSGTHDEKLTATHDAPKASVEV